MKYNNNKKITQNSNIIHISHITLWYAVSIGLTHVVSSLWKTSHTQISKNIFLFQNLLLVDVLLMYENTTIAFSVIHFSHFLQKKLGTGSYKIKHSYSKGPV